MTNEQNIGSSAKIDSAELLHIVQQLTAELHPGQPLPTVTLDSSLERDLGLDSLTRMELLTRIENIIHLRLPEQAIAMAETPRDLLRHLYRQDVQTYEGIPEIQLTEQDTSDSIVTPHSALTLAEVLEFYSAVHPERIHIIIESTALEPINLTYRQLHDGAKKVAAGLQEMNLQPGNAVAIILPTGVEYFFSFMGILLAGGIPVPLYPPVRPTQIEEHLKRHVGILRNASTSIMITMPEVKPIARLLKMQVDSLENVTTVSELTDIQNNFTQIPLQPGDIAFLQYTSGSTGAPKGVVLTNKNLLANIRAMGRVTEVSAADVFVSWLPLYHDMGLIGAWFGSLYHGCRLVIMPPLSFIARPDRWLRTIHKYRGTLSASPNFGYELCYRRIKDSDLEGVDLSCWRLAFNGAEPVTPETINNFCDRFASFGFRKEAMAPVYGLAESSVGLAFPPPGRKPIIDRIDREYFSRTGQAVPVTDPDTSALEFVACGQPLPGHQIRIVDANGRELPERREGTLQFKGPSTTSGYFRNPDQTRKLFDDEWLDSGDLAYTAEGDIYLTGRIKDVIIRGGRNIYPHELEESVGNINGIRKGSVAVFGSRDKITDTERLIVLAETRKKNPESIEKLRQEINDMTIDLLGLPPDDVALVPPGTVLKTSSGKIRRSASRDLYEQGQAGMKKKAVWLQFAGIIFAGIIPLYRKLVRQVGEYLYATWCWTIYCILAPAVWLLVILLPLKQWRWRTTSTAARLLGLLTGTRVIVKGLENIPRDRSVIIVANHSSYLDAYVLQAVLPVPCSFIAKAELAEKPLVRIPLTRLGAILVERFDRSQVVEEAGKISDIAAEGKNLLFFPEGTFQRMPGLLPFRMGAFLISARKGIPVIPVTIRGTRNKLRADSWFPRKGVINVTIDKPVQPSGTGWQDALYVKDQVRRAIMRHTGEPDLGGVHASFAELAAQEIENKKV